MLISLDRDSAISFIQRMKVRLHILICAWCKRYIRQIDLLHAEIRRQAKPQEKTVPQDVLERLKKAVRTHL